MLYGVIMTACIICCYTLAPVIFLLNADKMSHKTIFISLICFESCNKLTT